MYLHRSALVFPAMALLAAAPAYASHPQDFASVLQPFLQAGDITPAEKMFLKDATSTKARPSSRPADQRGRWAPP
jgi:hypothetical protein